MSLTDLLKDSGSPVRAFLKHVSPALEAAAGNTESAQIAASDLGLKALADSKAIVPRAAGVQGTLSGTAFDFRVRMELPGFDTQQSAAAAGISRAAQYRELIENGHHRVNVLSEIFDLAKALIEEPRDAADLDVAAILLGHCERVMRTGSRALTGSTGQLLDDAVNGSDFANKISSMTVGDIASLADVSQPQLEEWRTEIADGADFCPNPTFAGSELVGGADADWIIGDTLIDCKVYNSLTVSELKEFLLQLLGYVMLDLNDSLGIRRVGIWLPRQGLMPTWSLTRLLSGQPDLLLPTLRKDFVRSTGRTQLAINEPVSERRRYQLLAENRNTPFETLIELARNHDSSIRRCVGRNPSTPEATIRALTTDRVWSVREAVAMNEKAPRGVLLALTGDRSSAVRRAVASNPRTPLTLIKGLTADKHTSVQWAAKSNPGHLGLERAPMMHPTNESPRDLAGTSISRDPDKAWSNLPWLGNFLLTLGETSESWNPMLNIPESSWQWGLQSGRGLDSPKWSHVNLPENVAHDLMRADRPDFVRQAAAWHRSIESVEVRDSLLTDTNPEIRWRTLRRSTDLMDSTLAPLLAELGSSREARVRFRAQGSSVDSYTLRYNRAQFSDEVLEVVAAHRSTPSEVLDRLCAEKSLAVRERLLKNPALAEDARTSLMETMMKSRLTETRVLLAQLDNLPPETLTRLSSDKSPEVRTMVAQRDGLHLSILRQLAVDSSWQVRMAVLDNENLSDDLLTVIATSLLQEAPDEGLSDVLEVVLRHDHGDIPEDAIADALARLSKSRFRDPDPRALAASHERTPLSALVRLSHVADPYVRAAVAGNQRTPTEVLCRLSSDSDEYVRSRVAVNEATPRTELVALSDDSSPTVRRSVAERVELDTDILNRLLDDKDIRVKATALANPSARKAFHDRGESLDAAKTEFDRQRRPSPRSRATLVTMSSNTRAEVRMEVAFDQNTGPDILTFLGGEARSKRVRRAVAANPNSPANLLASLAHDSDEQVRQAVAFNGSTPRSVLLDLATQSIDLALLVALNPDIPEIILGALMDDTEPLVHFVAKEVHDARMTSIRAATADTTHNSVSSAMGSSLE
ncbi:HEAT repeat domain-containing protein [Paenarthrobacter sp. TA1.8]|uniref:HEAT repeat domain-containing protein n=1 Tax=Paenarthrobacter sp. TA1.8 TaxID=3400219 RepID=UPI003B4377F9